MLRMDLSTPLILALALLAIGGIVGQNMGYLPKTSSILEQGGRNVIAAAPAAGDGWFAGRQGGATGAMFDAMRAGFGFDAG